MIAIADHAEGCILPVRAQPGARRNAVLGEQAESLKVAVTAPPDQGKANKAIVAVLCEFLGVKRSLVEVIAGLTSRQKKFLVRGVTSAELRVKLQVVISEPEA